MRRKNLDELLDGDDDIRNADTARRANDFVKKNILDTSTLPAKSPAEKQKKIETEKAIGQARDVLKKELGELNLTQDSEFYYLYRFQRAVELLKSTARGNCGEHALLALYYVTNQEPDAEAEVFTIKGSDHAFLVIGRKLPSDPNDPGDYNNPDMWGENAYICDAWSPAENVYPAREYRKNLVAYDPNKHTFERYGNFNTSTIRHSKTHILNITLAAVKKYQSELAKLRIKLAKEYGINDPRSKMIAAKMNDVEHARGIIASLSRERRFDEKLQKTLQQSFDSILFTKDQWKVLIEGKRFNKVKRYLHSIFGVKAGTARAIDKVEKTLEKNINTAQPLVKIKSRLKKS